MHKQEEGEPLFLQGFEVLVIFYTLWTGSWLKVHRVLNEARRFWVVLLTAFGVSGCRGGFKILVFGVKGLGWVVGLPTLGPVYMV